MSRFVIGINMKTFGYWLLIFIPGILVGCLLLMFHLSLGNLALIGFLSLFSGVFYYLSA
jgi:hypothetical protein